MQNMDRKSFEKTFSEKRMEKYFNRYAEPEKAIRTINAILSWQKHYIPASPRLR
jgi:hypothetical protein